MHLTIAANDSELVVFVECSENDTVLTVKTRVSEQTGIPSATQSLSFQGRHLRDDEVLARAGVSEGDLMMLHRQQERTGTVTAADASAQEIINRVQQNPQLLSHIERNQPELAAAIRSNDVTSVRQVLTRISQEQNAREQELEQLMQNPMNADSQEKIWEMIRQKNVEENFAQALEHTPEVFGSVTMLYVSMEINDHPVQAFVDTGAQMTIMTEEFAQKTGLLRLVDKRFEGVAIGVGESKIIGRVHQAPLKIAEQYLSSSVAIINQKAGPPFIFGLDNLIRHQCCVDLESMKLKFGSVGVEIPFLPEHLIVHHDSRLTHGEGQSSETPIASEDKIQRLMDLGFDRLRCVRALQETGGNEETAAAILFEENASLMQ
eukprot:g7532.t1